MHCLYILFEYCYFWITYYHRSMDKVLAPHHEGPSSNFETLYLIIRDQLRLFERTDQKVFPQNQKSSLNHTKHYTPLIEIEFLTYPSQICSSCLCKASRQLSGLVINLSSL